MYELTFTAADEDANLTVKPENAGSKSDTKTVTFTDFMQITDATVIRITSSKATSVLFTAEPVSLYDSYVWSKGGKYSISCSNETNSRASFTAPDDGNYKFTFTATLSGDDEYLSDINVQPYTSKGIADGERLNFYSSEVKNKTISMTKGQTVYFRFWPWDSGEEDVQNGTVEIKKVKS